MAIATFSALALTFTDRYVASVYHNDGHSKDEGKDLDKISQNYFNHTVII